MAKSKIQFGSKIGWVLLSLSVSYSSGALAKVRPISIAKAKPIEANSIKGVTGEASLVLQRSVMLPADGGALSFQQGQITENIEFYQSPRCYLHSRKGTQLTQNTQPLASGHKLQVNKIDNIYANGAVHVTFWFDRDPVISDLSCITNYNHTLTLSEIRTTLGHHFQILVTPSLENDALFNTAPNREIKVLSEENDRNPIDSARIILTDS